MPFGVAQLMLTILSVLFYIGLIKESDKLMIPMIVAKVSLFCGKICAKKGAHDSTNNFEVVKSSSHLKLMNANFYKRTN